MRPRYLPSPHSRQRRHRDRVQSRSRHRRILAPRRVPLRRRMKSQTLNSDRNLNAAVSRAATDKVRPVAAAGNWAPRHSRHSVRRWTFRIGRLPSHRSEARSRGSLMLLLPRRRYVDRIPGYRRPAKAFPAIFRARGLWVARRHPFRCRQCSEHLGCGLLFRGRHCRRPLPSRPPSRCRPIRGSGQTRAWISRQKEHLRLRNPIRRRRRAQAASATKTQKRKPGSLPKIFRAPCVSAKRSAWKFESRRLRSSRLRKISMGTEPSGSTRSR